MKPMELNTKGRRNRGQVTHAYKQSMNISIVDITLHRRLYGYLIQLFKSGCFKKTISPLSHSLLCNIATLAFVPAFLQAYTCCRFGELKQIGVHNIKTHSPFIIHSSKSDHVRSISAVPILEPQQLRRINPATKVMVISYDSYKNSIKQAKSRLKIIEIKDILDCTHIFRHIEASWRFSQGVPLSDISYHLGHVSHSTTRTYIHPKLGV